MALSRESRKLIEGGDFAGLEDQWIERLATTPDDLGYFVGVARSLGGAGQETLARDLLDVLDDHLKSEKAWSERLDLLRRAGHLMRPPDKLHEEILDTLHRLHPDSPSRDGLLELVGLHRAKHDTAKTWKKVTRFQVLMQFEVGTVVAVEGKGAGRITEVNLELSKLKIDMDGKPALTVGFAAAGKLLTPLGEGHFLRRKLEDPDAVREAAKENPAGVLAELLASHDEPLAAGDIREALSGVVAPSSWTSWWSAARSHPQVMVTGKGARQRYGWADSSDAASDQALAAFDGAKSLAKKLQVFGREAKRGGDLKREMAERLAAEGAKRATKEPARALAIWKALDKAGATFDDEGWSPSALVNAATDPASWLPSIEDKALRAKAAGFVRRQRDDWVEIYLRWLRNESEPRLLKLLTDALAKDSRSDLDAFVDDVLAHPKRYGAAFAWLVETIGDSDLLAHRNPLRLLQLVVESPGKATDGKVRTRLKKALVDGPVLANLLAKVETDQAQKSEELVKRAPIPDYLRDQLRTQLQLRFPGLGSGEDDSLYALTTSIDERRKQLKHLLEEEIPANRRAIEEARALGDLRENFEYKSARQRHEYLSARVSQLDADLNRARPIDFETVDVAKIRIGTTAVLRRQDDESRITILGPWESDPDRGVVSYQADTAKALISKKIGDTVDFDDAAWTVAAIEPFQPGDD